MSLVSQVHLCRYISICVPGVDSELKIPCVACGALSFSYIISLFSDFLSGVFYSLDHNEAHNQRPLLNRNVGALVHKSQTKGNFSETAQSAFYIFAQNNRFLSGVALGPPARARPTTAEGSPPCSPAPSKLVCGHTPTWADWAPRVPWRVGSLVMFDLPSGQS